MNVRPARPKIEKIEGLMNGNRPSMGDSIERQILRRLGHYGKTMPKEEIFWPVNPS